MKKNPLNQVNYLEGEKKWSKQDTVLLAILFCFSIILLFNNLEGETIPTYDESYMSYLDCLMMTRNVDILLPVSGYVKYWYFMKPPLKTLLKYPFLKVFGLNLVTLRALDASMALITVLLAFFLARKFFGRYPAFITGMMLITNDSMYIFWSRTNQVDAGFILSAVLFFFFYFYLYEKKYGFIACGLALSFAAGFKHINAILPLGILGIYLILSGQFKEFFRKRFWGMIFTAVLLPGLWAVAFQLKNPDFFKTFINIEILQRVVTGIDDKYRGFFYYFINLKTAGPWFYILPAALIFIIFLYIRKKSRKLLFLNIWIFASIIGLSFAHYKSIRYLGWVFPALGMAIGIFLTCIFNLIKNSGIKYSIPLSRLYIFTLILFLILSFGNYIAYTNNMHQENYHIYDNYYSGENKGKLINTLKWSEFERSEYIHTYLMKNLVISKKSLLKEIKDLNSDDSILASRRDYLQLFFNKNLSTQIKTEDYLAFNFSNEKSFRSNNPTVKIVLLRKGSNLEKYLRKKNISLQPMNHSIDTLRGIAGNRTFVQKVSLNLLGYETNKNVTDYFASLLDNQMVNRDMIYEMLKKYALKSNTHYNFLLSLAGLKTGIIDSHPYRLLLYKNMIDNVVVYNTKRNQFLLMPRIELSDKIKKWKFIQNPKKDPDIMIQILNGLDDKTLLIAPSYSVEKISALRKKLGGINNPDDLYCCEFMNKNQMEVDNNKFPDLLIIIRKDHPGYDLLSQHHIMLRKLVGPDIYN